MKIFIIVLVSFFLTSCNFNTTNKNRESDKQEAEKEIQKFYSLIQRNNTDAIFKLASKDLFKITSKNNFNQILNSASIECGSIKDYSLIQWETLVINGTNPKSEYVLVYNVIRSIKNTKEKFTLKKENDSIKILGYNIEY